MKITLERAPFLAALGRAHKMVERRNTIPILANLCLKAEDSRLVITATDLDIEITEMVEAEVTAAGETTAPAHTLHDIARKVADGAQIQMETAGDGGTLTVRAGRSRFSLQTLPANEFPDFTAGAPGVTLSIPGKMLAEAMGRVEFAISTEETRYYLNGIYIHRAEVSAGEHRLTLVATDGHRLSLMRLPVQEVPADLPGVILPRKAVDIIRRMAEEVGDDTLHFEISASKLAASDGDVRVVTKLIDDTFPDYGRVIPLGNSRIATVKAENLAAAVERVATLASDKGRAVKFTFGAESGGLVLEAANPEAGTARDEIDCGWAGDEMSIGFNGTYVAGLLKAVAAAEIEIALADPGSPSLWRRSGSADALCVLMPMRV